MTIHCTILHSKTDIMNNQDSYICQSSKFSQIKALGGNLPSGFCRVEMSFFFSFGALTVLIRTLSSHDLATLDALHGKGL